ncbi:hypothetical protein [Phaffia rhodozyma]|uniref:Uncharacterized protein n=1 Tax=Phaffia rhodozyma TaxID=264483 RepID=A0A0F7STU6_PHARH|nr:hypothetical protein [Phaffia rhodozyma]
MPHKRAKKSVRDATRKTNGKDQAPGAQDLEREGLPKGAMRILNSMQTQDDFRKRKRENKMGLSESGPGGGKKKNKVALATPSERKTGNSKATTNDALGPSSSLKIVPGESLAHFNRRVEDSLRANIAVASKKAQAHSTEIFRQEKEERKQKHDARVAEREEKKRLKAEQEAMEAEAEEEGSQNEDNFDDEEESESKPKIIAKAGPSATSSTSKPAAHPSNGKLTPTTTAKSTPSITVTPTAIAVKPKKVRATEFASAVPSSAPKRLNDIAQAPPTLTLPRLASKAIKANAGSVETSAGARVGISVGQARILAEERERVIARYREIKEKNGLKASMGLQK